MGPLQAAVFDEPGERMDSAILIHMWSSQSHKNVFHSHVKMYIPFVDFFFIHLCFM